MSEPVVRWGHVLRQDSGRGWVPMDEADEMLEARDAEILRLRHDLGLAEARLAEAEAARNHFRATLETIAAETDEGSLIHSQVEMAQLADDALARGVLEGKES